MGGIFISYRREDSGPYAGRLRDALSQHFGANQVFRDIDRINPGERFPLVIEQEVGSCQALLAVIGSTWLSIKDDAGHRRLEDPEDYVRLEIATALGRSDVLVIPVLVGPTSMPPAVDLPEPLASLAERNAVRITDEGSWDDQVARLTRALDKVIPRPVVPTPPQVAVPQAEVTATGKVGAGNAKARAGWLRRKMRPELSRAALISYADHLAEAVALRETVLLDQLRGGPDTVMDLEFQAARFRSADGDAVGVMSNIGPYFRRQASPRRLLVVGEAGAGKTVLAVHLLLDQLRDRAALSDNLRIDTPVPVRVNIAGWDGGGDFTSWMASRLGTDYGLNQKVALALADAGYILPVLDGLDEMDPPDAGPERARVALDRLNEPPWRNRTVVVMCRTGVYDRIRELRGDAGLHGATTITLQPLSSIEICDYLHHHREQLGIPNDAWVPVTEQVGHDPDGPLATALRTPWLLGLATTALRRDRRTATQLAACGDTTEIRNLLFAALIPAAIHGTRRTGRTRDYTEQKVQTWMHTLAQHLERRRTEGMGGTEITLEQVWALAGTRRCRALHALAVGVMFGLTFALLAGLTEGLLAYGLWGPLMFGLWGGFVAGLMPSRGLSRRDNLEPLMQWLVAGLAVGLVVALPFGQLYGLLVGLAAVLTANITGPKRFAWRVPGRSRWRRGLAVGVAVGLGSGLMYLVIVDITGFIFAASLMFGTAVGLVTGFMTGLSTNADDRLALGQDARRVIHDDLVAALTVGLIFGLPSALLVALTDWRIYGFIVGLTPGLTLGPLVALLVGLTAGRHATASLLFAITEIFPARPVQFMEWARNAGLLRVTGIAYQCRHDTYQQWLAAGDVGRGVKTTFDAQAS